MADIAELGFRLDTRDLTRGKGALDELSRSADHAGGSAGAFERRLDAVTAASRKAQQSADSLAAGFRGVAAAAGGLYVLDKALDSLRQFPALGIKAAASLETMQLGLAGTLASMGKIENKAIDIAKAQKIAADVTGVLQQKAMETAASTEDLVSAYRALLGPGLAAKMSMQQLVEFTVTGVNAVKSIGLQSNQVVQELRDLVAGGIQPASSTLATAIGVTDKDIAKIKKEGGDLFAFLMDRLSGFQQTSLLYNQTYSGRLDALREGMTKLAEQGFKPLFEGLKDGFAGALDAIGQTEKSVVMLNGKMQEVSKWKLDQDLVNSLQDIATSMVDAGKAAIDAAKLAYEYRDAIATIAIAYAALKTSQITGAIVGGWAERIAASRAAMVADAQAAKVALERAAADNAVAIGASRRAVVEKEAAMVALQKAQADVLAAKNAMGAAVTDTEKAAAAKRLELAERQRAAATLSAATASQVLSQGNAAATATTTALAAAQRTATATTTAAGVAVRAFGGIIGALGGPIGIAITALIGLAFYWDEIKTKAFGAAESAESAANRIKSALASSNIAAANAGLDSLRASRSTIEKELGRVDAILKNESGLSALDVSKLTQQRQQLSQESEKVRSEILKSEAEIRKAKEGQAKQAVELVNGYASPLEKRLGLIKTETKAVADAMTALPDVQAKYPTQLDDKDRKKKDKEAAKAAKELASEQAKLNDLLQKGEGFSATYAEKLALLTKYQSKIPVDEYRAAVEKLILTETEAGKTAAKHAEEVAKLQDTFHEEDAKRAANLQIQNEELQFQSSLLGKTALEQAALTAQWEEEKKIREEILDLTNKQAQAEQDGNQWAATAIQDRINMLESDAAARKEAAAGIAMQKEIQQQWGNISADIERALTDSLMRGFDSGKGFADSLKDYIKNAFESLAIRILLQPVMGVVNSVGGQLYGQIMGGQPQQGQQQAGFSDIIDTFSRGKSNYDNMITSAIKSEYGQALGLSTPITYTDAWAAGQNVAGATVTTGAEITALGEAASTAGQALGYLPAVMQAAEDRYISAVGSAVGQYFGGPIGSMAGAAIGGLLDDAFGFGDKKPDERKARFGYGASDALREEGLRTGWTGSSVFGEFRTYNDKWFSDSEMRPAMSAFVDSLENLDNTVADSLKLTADQTQSAIEALKAIDKEYSFGLQWGDFTANSKAREQIAVDRYAAIFDSIDAGWGDFVRQFQGSFDEFPTYLQGVIAAMSLFREESGDLVDVFGKQIDGIGAFAEFAKAGENNADAFKRLYSVFQATNAVLESLGKSAKGTGLETTALRESFINLAGGMESLSGYVQQYYDGFYTEAERNAKVMADLRKEFAAYGAELPATREQWRKLAESLDLSTDEGQKAAIKMYELQGAFLSVTPAIGAAKSAIDELEKKALDLGDDALRKVQNRERTISYKELIDGGMQAKDAVLFLSQALYGFRQAGVDTKNVSRELTDALSGLSKSFSEVVDKFKTQEEIETESAFDGLTELGKAIASFAQNVASSAKELNSMAEAEKFAEIALNKNLSWDAPRYYGASSRYMPEGDPARESALAWEKYLDEITQTTLPAETKRNDAMKKLAGNLFAESTRQVNSAFDEVVKTIDGATDSGLSEVARKIKEATGTMTDRLTSVFESIDATVKGLVGFNTVGVSDVYLNQKVSEIKDSYDKGKIKAEDVAGALTSVFAAVDIPNADLFIESIAQAITSSKKALEITASEITTSLIKPWREYYDTLLTSEYSIDDEINAAIKAKDQALADAKTLAESLGKNFDDLAKEIQRGFDAQLFGLTKQKLQGVIDSISKITDFQAGIDDAIFGLRIGMSGADVSGLYAQRQAEIKAQLDAAMLGDNLDEQIGLANKLRETITQRYAAEQQAQERMMSFARGLGDYLRRLRTSDKSTGSIYDRLTEAQKQFAEDVALSRGTGAEADAARGRITSTSDTLLDLARQFYASGEGYQQIYNGVVGGLEGLQIDTRTEAERQLDAINAGNDSALKQISELQALRGTFDSKLGALQQQQATYIAEMQKLAGQLGLSQSAILQALKDLPSSISGAIAGIMPMPAVGSAGGAKVPTAPSGSATQTAFEKAVQSYRETGTIAGGVETIAAAVAESGMGYQATILAIKDAAKIDGSHKDGLSHVPFDGYVAELHKGERVLTASENRDYSADVSRIMGGGYGGQAVAPLLNEIKALRQEVAQLRQQQSSEHQDDLRQREAIAKQSMGQTKDLQTAMVRNTALNI